MSRHHLERLGSCIVLMRGPLGVVDIKPANGAFRVTGYGVDSRGDCIGEFPTFRAALRAAIRSAYDFYTRAGLVPMEHNDRT